MRRSAPTVALFAVIPIAAVAGCNKTSDGDPFESADRGVEVRPPLRAAVGTVVGGLGYAADAVGLYDPPRAKDYAGLMVDADSTPDERVRGINGLVAREYGREPPYTDAYAEVARVTDDPLVRATALRALNRSRSEPHAATFAEFLADDDERVRLEAAKGLANLPSAEAAGPLLGRASDPAEDVDVRIAAVDALRHYADPEVIARLAELLGDDAPFGVSFQARASLARLVGEDRGYDPARYVPADEEAES